MKRIILFFILLIFCIPCVAGADFPQSSPSGMEPVVFYDDYSAPWLNAWGWRENFQVWVELEKASGSSSEIPMIQKNSFYVKQDGVDYYGACVALEKHNVCGSFEMRTPNDNESGNYIYRIDISDTDTTDKWDYKRAYRIYYMDDNANYIQIPEVVTYELSFTVNPAESGMVEGAGLYEANEPVAVSAVASEGYQFSHWGDDTSDTGSVKNYQMPLEDAVLTANFVVAQTNPDPGSSGSDSAIDDAGCFIGELNY